MHDLHQTILRTLYVARSDAKDDLKSVGYRGEGSADLISSSTLTGSKASSGDPAGSRNCKDAGDGMLFEVTTKVLVEGLVVGMAMLRGDGKRHGLSLESGPVELS